MKERTFKLGEEVWLILPRGGGGIRANSKFLNGREGRATNRFKIEDIIYTYRIIYYNFVLDYLDSHSRSPVFYFSSRWKRFSYLGYFCTSLRRYYFPLCYLHSFLRVLI